MFERWGQVQLPAACTAPSSSHASPFVADAHAVAHDHQGPGAWAMMFFGPPLVRGAFTTSSPGLSRSGPVELSKLHVWCVVGKCKVQ